MTHDGKPLSRWALYHAKKTQKQLKYSFNMFPAKTVCSQLGIGKGELLKSLELGSWSQRSCRAKYEGCRLSLKQGWRTLATGTGHVAFVEAVKGHMLNLSLPDFQTSVCHGPSLICFLSEADAFLVMFWDTPAASLVMFFHPEEAGKDLLICTLFEGPVCFSEV